MENQEVNIKLLIIGHVAVGKTSILIRYTDNDFISSYLSTLGTDFKTKKITVDDTRIKLQIWDTAGQERFECITTTFYRGTDGVVIVYDVNNRSSFKNLNTWVSRAQQELSDLPWILVGNKAEDEKLRQVSVEEGTREAQKLGCPFIETSAKNNTNIDELFDQIIKRALEEKLKGGSLQRNKPMKLRSVGKSKSKNKSKCCSSNDIK